MTFEMVPPEGTIRGARRGLPLLLTPTSGLRDLQKEFLPRMSTLIKKRKLNFPHISGNLDGSGCKVIYEEGLPNI
jgi:hypothetical protein